LNEETRMKEIKAIIQPHMLGRVMSALHELPHFPGVTVSDCQGQGRGRGKGGHYEAEEDTIYYVKKTKVEVFCADAAAEAIVETLRTAAHTGNAGDGIVMVMDVERVVRVRSGQEQDEAV
jgi:nitrogen regulatory protein P-II 1